MPNEFENCPTSPQVMQLVPCDVPEVDVAALSDEVSVLSKNQKTFSDSILHRTDLLDNLAILCSQNEIEFMKIMKSVETDGVAKKEVAELKGILKRRSKTIRTKGYNPAHSKFIRGIIPDAPVGEHAVMPCGYFLGTDFSISYEYGDDEKSKPVSPVPIFISQLKYDAGSSLEYATICWPKGHSWRSVTVERKTIAKRSMIVDLASQGLPITSNNCDMIINYLFAYEQANAENIIRTKVQNQLGWTNDMSGFLWGRHFITEDLSTLAEVEFVGREPGDEQFAEGFVSSGSYDEWTRLANEMLDYPHVAFSFYASMMTPLLPILEVKNFTLELANRSSTGKSIALQFAASAWGRPDLQSNSFVNSWNVSPTWPGRAASLLNGLPMFLDDTKQARVNDHRRDAGTFVADTMFLIAAGRDRAKGNVNGTERVPSFKTVLLSTGEFPTLDNNRDGGIRGRAICICGDPFGKADTSTKAVVDRVDWIIREHHGHAGPRLVKFILEHRDQWDIWKQAYREINTRMTRTEGLTSIEMRLGEYFAAVATAIPIIHAALPELRRDKRVCDLLTEIGNKARQEAVLADTSTQALQSVVDWLIANQNRMYSPVISSQGHQWSDGDYICFWDLNDHDEWTYIGLESSSLKQHLKQNGFNPMETFRNWKVKGWLSTNGTSQGYQKQVCIPGTSPHGKFNKMSLYCITKESVDKILENDS